MRFNLYLRNVQAVKDRIRRMRERLGDPRPVLQRAVVTVLDHAKYEIQVGGEPPWAPTKKPSNKHHILIRTGALLNSLSMSNPEAYHFETDSKVLVGTNIHYAKWLQGGTKFMPARKFLEITPQMASEIKEQIAQWALKGE